MALANEYGRSLALGESFYCGADGADAGSADEDHLERAAGQAGGGGEDGGIVLAPVGVALDGDVEGGEGVLVGVFDVGGQQDGAAQVPKVGFVRTKERRMSKKPSRSRWRRRVVDSPPGRMRPSSASSSAGRLMRRGSASACARARGVDLVSALESEDADDGLCGLRHLSLWMLMNQARTMAHASARFAQAAQAADCFRRVLRPKPLGFGYLEACLRSGRKQILIVRLAAE